VNETIYVTDPATANEGYKALVTGLEKKLLPLSTAYAAAAQAAQSQIRKRSNRRADQYLDREKAGRERIYQPFAADARFK